MQGLHNINTADYVFVNQPHNDRREFLRGVVDMGSNGIRFSVSDLSPSTARVLPTLHLYRVDLSLYDVQIDPESGKRIPIPADVIDAIIGMLLRFQVVCKDLGVLDENIRVIATEATRTAKNSAEFLHKVHSATGITIRLLPKEEEGMIGALGIASGYSEIEGLAMDLGGGSTQLTWIISRAGNVRISPKGAFSFPYGAAALSQKLDDLRKNKSEDEGNRAIEAFRHEMANNFLDAYHQLGIPPELTNEAARNGGYHLYLSGGGFRGWGYLLMYLNQVHGNHYPISVINGFSVPKSQFEDTEIIQKISHTAHKIFRFSDRRRSQAPAVAFLINVLANALPLGFVRVHFCQGGVREGVLFREIPPSVRQQDPLEVSTHKFAPRSAIGLFALCISSIPSPSKSDSRAFPKSISQHVLQAFINLLYQHAIMSKETASSAALSSTSTGILSTTNGISHTDRALLALLLEERYLGELPPREADLKLALQQLLNPELVWWTRYIGKVGMLLGRLYPAGFIDEFKPRVVTSSEWSNCLGKHKSKRGLILNLSIQKVENDRMRLKEALEDYVSVIENVGKRKNWPGGSEGWGMKVKVLVVEEGIVSN